MMAVGAFAVFGVGQTVWQKEEVQKIADLTAKAAAGDLANAANGFPQALQYAALNGYDQSTDSISIACNVKGTNTTLAAADCQQSVLVTVTRSVPAVFMSNQSVIARAEATLSPVVTGVVGTNLLNINTDDSTLSTLFNAIGVQLNLKLVPFQGLLNSTAEVSLLDLGVQLGVFNQGDAFDLNTLLAGTTSSADLINGALAVLNDPALETPIQNPGGVINTATFPLSEIFSAANASSANLSDVRVSLSSLVYTSVMRTAQDLTTGTLSVSLGPGQTVRLTVDSPPKIFIAVKKQGGPAIIAEATSEKVGAELRSGGVALFNVSGGNGTVYITDIQCRLPESQSATVAYARSGVLDTSVQVQSSQIPALLKITFNALLAAIGATDPFSITLNVASTQSATQTITGFPSESGTKPGYTYNFSFADSFSNLYTAQLNALAGNPLYVGLNLLTGVINPILTSAGSTIDSTILPLIGLNVNQVVVRIDSMKCYSAAVLTR